MIEHKDLTLKFIDPTSAELEILEKYWGCDDQGIFSETLAQIMHHYHLKQHELYKLAQQKTLGHWNFGTCPCGNAILMDLTKRSDLLNGLQNYRYLKEVHYNKCKSCIEKEKEEKWRQEEERWRKSSSYLAYPESEPVEDVKDKINSLNTWEIRKLFDLYSIKDFKSILSSPVVFPVRSGELHTMVWRAIYKFDRMGLIFAEKNNNRIQSIIFHLEVEDILKEMVQVDPFMMSKGELEVSLSRVVFDETYKYISVFEPETDLVLKAGCKYLITGSITLNKSLIIRISEASDK